MARQADKNKQGFSRAILFLLATQNWLVLASHNISEITPQHKLCRMGHPQHRGFPIDPAGLRSPYYSASAIPLCVSAVSVEA